MPAQQCLSALWAPTITLASSVYLIELIVIFSESGAGVPVSFTFTGDPSPNVELQIFCLLLICVWLSFCSPHFLPRWGKMKVSVWETITCSTDNDLQRKSPENRKETNSWLYPRGRAENKAFALRKHHRPTSSSPARGPRVLKPGVYGSSLLF